MTKEEVFELVQGNIPILVRNPKTGKITNPFSTRYGYDAVVNGLTEAIVKKLNIAPVVVPKGKLCGHKFKDLTFIRDRQIVCKCGKRFSH